MIISVDPNEYHIPKGATKVRLVRACGIIPAFAAEAYAKGNETAQDVYDAMVERYGFGDMSSTKWGTVDPTGVYKSAYDEDPDMQPLVELRFPENPVKVYIYQYAIVAVVDEDTTIISRMD